MKKSILLSLLLMIGVMAYADATGQKCREAIPLGKNYTEEVKAGQTIWYSAWTFDLPLSVYFAPTKGEGQPAPEVEMDFSCVSGYYTDPILCSLFCKTSGGSGIGKTAEKLAPSVPGAEIVDAKVVKSAGEI